MADNILESVSIIGGKLPRTRQDDEYENSFRKREEKQERGQRLPLLLFPFPFFFDLFHSFSFFLFLHFLIPSFVISAVFFFCLSVLLTPLPLLFFRFFFFLSYIAFPTPFLTHPSILLFPAIYFFLFSPISYIASFTLIDFLIPCSFQIKYAV